MTLTIWDAELPYPSPTETPVPIGLTRILAHDGQLDLLPFLHDCTLTTNKSRLILGWYNSTNAEICGSSLIRGRYTDDGGRNWSNVFHVVGEIDYAEEHFVPACFFTHQGSLYALITKMAGKNLTVSLSLYKAHANSLDNWSEVSIIAGGFLCNCPPILMDTNNYLAGVWMPMKQGNPAFPAVLISQGSEIAKPWRCSFLYDPLAPRAVNIRCPEIALNVSESNVTAYVRNDEGKPGDPSGGKSLIFTSRDYGDSWIGPVINPMPVGNSKIFSGYLSNGRRYIIYNHDLGFFARSLLCIALSEIGTTQYTKVYKLFENGAAEFGGRGHHWFYPCACEHEGFLYVACTMEELDRVRSAAIAKIPINSL